MRNEKRLLAVAFVALALFLRVVSMISSGAAVSFDTQIRDGVHSWSSPLLTAIMQGVSIAGTDVFMGALIAGTVWWMLRLGRRRDAIILVVTAVAAELLMEATKLGFHRLRPEPFFGIPPPDSYSFPSGHALKSAVVYILLALLATSRISIRIGAVVFALLIGLSRIYLGVHYPTDVLGGYALAAICLAAAAAYRRMPV